MPVLKATTLFVLVCGVGFSVASRCRLDVLHQSPAPQAAAPADAEQVRAEIRAVENLLPKVPDRGAALFFLARGYAHLGDLPKALALLKECMTLDAGFVPEPAYSRSLRALEPYAEFRKMLEAARRRYPAVHRARVAFTVPATDLFPEGLAVSPRADAWG